MTAGPIDPPPPPASRRPARLEVVRVRRPRCPRCGGGALRKYRSLIDQGDGTGVSWVRCLEPRCAHRFRIVVE